MFVVFLEMKVGQEMLIYMYIDESGGLGVKKGCSKYFVISALLVKEPERLNRIIKNMRRNVISYFKRTVSLLQLFRLHMI